MRHPRCVLGPRPEFAKRRALGLAGALETLEPDQGSGDGVMNYDADMPPYIQEMADWLDGKKVHQCNFDHAALGAEIMLAMQRSAAEGGQIALPLAAGADEQALLKAKLADKPVLVSCEQNKKEFGLA